MVINKNMTINLFGEIQCTLGWEYRCGQASCEDCSCACGGKNHGKFAGKRTHENSTTLTKFENVIIRVGDALAELKNIADESVDCIVTSPPYWGLRDYSHPDQIGQENQLSEYIGQLLRITLELKRVLKKAGQCFGTTATVTAI